MAKNDNRDNKNKPQRLGVTPNTINPNQKSDDENWNDEKAEAEAESNQASNAAERKAQLDSRAEAEGLKEGFFEKVVHKVKDALHIDEPKHLSHATPRIEDPQHVERIKEAHKVELGDEGEFFKEMPINKVPGKLRKFVSNN